MLQAIRQKIKSASNRSGVYVFKDKNGKSIYIGRALNLKNRVKDYLNSSDQKSIRLLEEAKTITYKTTHNLLLAIILEANLIKKYQPKYNIRGKDNRSFVYIVIPKNKWSYPFISRERELSKYEPLNAFIFGPVKSFGLAKNLLLVLRKIYPWSNCRFNSGKPCFYYQIGLCPGKCLGLIDASQYQKNINKIIEILKGKSRKLLNIDDTILITKEPINNKLFNNSRIEAYDISHFAGKETVGAMVVYQKNDFDKSQYRLFKIKTARPNDDISALSEILARRLKHKEWQYPDLILVDGGKTQVAAVRKILMDNKIVIPIVGITKFRNDRLVFSKMKKSLKDLILLSFNELQKIRDEAHRFANSYRKKLLRKSLIGN
jgi:excinuclease ABC subunit C